MVRDCWLPADLAPGDLLAVAATGAYCYSMASSLQPAAAPRGGRRARRRGAGAAAPRDVDDQFRLEVGRMSAVNGDRPIRVALLGCGTVGSEVVRLLREQADELAARVGAPRRAGRGGRAPPAPAPRAGRPAHHGRVRAGHARRRGRRRRGDRRHRAGPHAAAGGAQGRQVGGHREQGAARRGRRRAGRGGRRVRRRPLLRGVGGRGDPAAAAAARVAGRRPDHPRGRHRQRHHELHPLRDGRLRGRATPTRWRRPPGWATPRPTRAPTSTATTPRPRPRSSPRSPSTPG